MIFDLKIAEVKKHLDHYWVINSENATKTS